MLSRDFSFDNKIFSRYGTRSVALILLWNWIESRALLAIDTAIPTLSHTLARYISSEMSWKAKATKRLADDNDVWLFTSQLHIVVGYSMRKMLCSSLPALWNGVGMSVLTITLLPAHLNWCDFHSQPLLSTHYLLLHSPVSLSSHFLSKFLPLP